MKSVAQFVDVRKVIKNGYLHSSVQSVLGVYSMKEALQQSQCVGWASILTHYFTTNDGNL